MVLIHKAFSLHLPCGIPEHISKFWIPHSSTNIINSRTQFSCRACLC